MSSCAAITLQKGISFEKSDASQDPIRATAYADARVFVIVNLVRAESIHLPQLL